MIMTIVGIKYARMSIPELVLDGLSVVGCNVSDVSVLACSTSGDCVVSDGSSRIS
jgi:hypothetical protein